MGAQTNCPYCHKPVSVVGLESHIQNYCKSAPASVKGKPEAVRQAVESALPKVLTVSVEEAKARATSILLPEPKIGDGLKAQHDALFGDKPIEIDSKPTLRISSDDIHVPEPDPFFMVKNSTLRELDRQARISEVHPVNILVTGLQGSGKTSLATEFAARNNRPFAEVQCGLMSEPGQWFGGLRFAPEHGTWYQESQFVRAVETPKCVVLLDELNRVENPKVMNSLFWLLDKRREAWVDDLQRRVKVASGVVFFATLNEGVIFAGVDFVDTALRDRFTVIEMEFPPDDEEEEIITLKTGLPKETATVLVCLANAIRENPNIDRKISTRQLLMAAEEIRFGASVREAVEFSISNSYGEQAQDILQALQAYLPESEARGRSSDGWRKY